MTRLAWARGRSRHSVGSAFTAGSTSAMRRVEASTSSRGEISPFLSRATASTADIRQSSLFIEAPILARAPAELRELAPDPVHQDSGDHWLAVKRPLCSGHTN